MRPRLAGGLAALVTILATSAQAQTPPSAQDPGLAGGDSRAPQERYFLRAQYREFHPSLSGEAQKGSAGREGSVLDLDDDLALDDKRTFDVRGVLQLRAGRKIRGSWTPLDYDGDTEARRTFTYGATRYDRFSRVVTSIKGAYYSADLEWDFVQRPRGYLGVVLGAKLFDVDTVVISPSQENSREVDTLRVPIPVIGLTGRVYASRVSLEAELTGLSVGSRGSMYEFETSARFHISDRLGVQGGFRLLNLEGKDGLDRVMLKLGGVTFGLELSL